MGKVKNTKELNYRLISIKNKYPNNESIKW